MCLKDLDSLKVETRRACFMMGIANFNETLYFTYNDSNPSIATLGVYTITSQDDIRLLGICHLNLSNYKLISIPNTLSLRIQNCEDKNARLEAILSIKSNKPQSKRRHESFDSKMLGKVSYRAYDSQTSSEIQRTYSTATTHRKNSSCTNENLLYKQEALIKCLKKQLNEQDNWERRYKLLITEVMFIIA